MSVHRNRIGRRTVDEQFVRQILIARRSRGEFLGNELFSDPAWDILLELYAAELGEEPVGVASIAQTVGLSANCAKRWIDALGQRSLVQAAGGCPLDRLTLSAKGSTGLRDYFTAVRPNTLPL